MVVALPIPADLGDTMKGAVSSIRYPRQAEATGTASWRAALYWFSPDAGILFQFPAEVGQRARCH